MAQSPKSLREKARTPSKMALVQAAGSEAEMSDLTIEVVEFAYKSEVHLSKRECINT